ncbi:MAG: hypothetical protein WC955_12245, partial [Elusimicrobiota bacterium]
DGLLLDDNAVGMNALKFRLSWQQRLWLEFIAAKMFEPYIAGKDASILLANVKYDLYNNMLSLYFMKENDGAILSVYPEKLFLGIRAERQMEKGAFYNIEIINHGLNFEFSQQQAQTAVNEKNAWTAKINGGLRTVMPAPLHYLGKTKVFMEYLYSTAGERFAPLYSRKWDGAERAGYGNIFGLMLNDTFTGYPASHKDYGIEVVNLGFTVMPLNEFEAGINFYSYAATGIQTENYFGNEIDAKAQYAVNDYLQFALYYSRYYPGRVFTLTETFVERICLEILTKF